MTEVRVAIIFLTAILVSVSIIGQDNSLTGLWKGKFQNNNLELEVYFDIGRNEKGLTCQMTVPNQFLKDVEAKDVKFSHDTLSFTYPGFRASFQGIYDKSKDEIKGIWHQGTRTELILYRSEDIARRLRPQEPLPPYPYVSEEISFYNFKDDVELAGTLTLPDTVGSFTAAILVSGSGPQNRDSELLGHKPFLLLSDYLTRHGIAVLRYDDRGIGKSKGNFSTATTLDFANDAAAAFAYLKKRKEIRKDAIGIIGHSEGGLIAPIVANMHYDIGFIILLAGPGEPIPDMMVKQNANVFKDYGFTQGELKDNEIYNTRIFNLIASEAPSEELFDTIKVLSKDYYNRLNDENKALFGPNHETYYISLASQLFSPWFRSFMKIKAADYLKRVKCPVLAINGSKDIQVHSESNLIAIQKALEEGRNSDYTIRELENLNHLFQNCTSCTVEEYAQLEETFAPIALELILRWIQKRF